MKKQAIIVGLLLSSLFLSACNNNATSSASESGTSATTSANVCDQVDYVAKTHLALAYEGKHFLTDGIGKVALKENVDGDTTHFYDLNADGSANTKIQIKSRYLCIDTPESTGQIQPWGKAASKFTASKINAAKTIVISSDSTTYKAATADSTGERYLSYVWVSEKENAALEDLQLLNLMIVQNGYSATKSATDTLYSDAFYSADAEAQCNKLVIWSGKTDPDYIYSTGTTTTIREMVLGRKYNSDTDSYDTYDWTDSTHNKVAFDCTVAMTSGDNAYVYDDLADPSDPTKTVRYGMYIFTGYRGIAPLTHVGWRLNVVGNCTSFNGNMQITNVAYSALYHTDDDITILSKDGPSTYTPAVVGVSDANKDSMMNVVVTIKNLHGVESGSYADNDEKAFTVKCQNDAGESISLRFQLGVLTDRSDISKTINVNTYKSYLCKAGETYNVTAPIARYVSTSGNVSYQLSLCHNADLVFNS